MAKTVCVRGHLLAETRVRNSSDGRARCRLCGNMRQLAYIAKQGPEWLRNKNLLRSYGITSAQWDTLFANQGEACAICKTGETRKWHTDHDHATGRVRGILCEVCNINLGQYEAMLKYKPLLEEYLK